jgi:RNA polymerase sigma-70 factor, ECF subfamily
MPSLTRASSPTSPSRAGEPARSEQIQPTRVDTLPGDDLAATVGPLLGLMARASRNILQDDGLADDAIQEALLTFWTRAEPPENPRAWLLHAVTLRSLHLARTCRRRRKHEKQAGLGRTEWSLRDDPTRSFDHEDLLRLLNEALGLVPDEYRAVFVLWAFEEMDYAGIAEELQIPIGTVRSRLNRTRRAIREALESRAYR